MKTIKLSIISIFLLSSNLLIAKPIEKTITNYDVNNNTFNVSSDFKDLLKKDTKKYDSKKVLLDVEEKRVKITEKDFLKKYKKIENKNIIEFPLSKFLELTIVDTLKVLKKDNVKVKETIPNANYLIKLDKELKKVGKDKVKYNEIELEKQLMFFKSELEKSLNSLKTERLKERIKEFNSVNYKDIIKSGKNTKKLEKTYKEMKKLVSYAERFVSYLDKDKIKLSDKMDSKVYRQIKKINDRIAKTKNKQRMINKDYHNFKIKKNYIKESEIKKTIISLIQKRKYVQAKSIFDNVPLKTLTNKEIIEIDNFFNAIVGTTKADMNIKGMVKVEDIRLIDSFYDNFFEELEIGRIKDNMYINRMLEITHLLESNKSISKVKSYLIKAKLYILEGKFVEALWVLDKIDNEGNVEVDTLKNNLFNMLKNIQEDHFQKILKTSHQKWAEENLGE